MAGVRQERLGPTDPVVDAGELSLIDVLRSEGVPILMSTRHIEETQRLADTVTITSQGQAVARPALRAPVQTRRAAR